MNTYSTKMREYVHYNHIKAMSKRMQNDTCIRSAERRKRRTQFTLERCYDDD